MGMMRLTAAGDAMVFRRLPGAYEGFDWPLSPKQKSSAAPRMLAMSSCVSPPLLAPSDE